MSLSISSSKAFLIILLSIVLAGTLVEFSVRQFVLPKSDNYKTIKRSSGLSSTFSLENRDVVVVGNSFTRQGLNDQFLESISGEVNLSFISLSGSHIAEWYWLSELHYLRDSNQPDNLVLNIGPSSLIDRSDIRHRRLSMIFGARNRPFVPEQVKASKAVEFVLGRYSQSINRGRSVGEAISQLVVPKFSLKTSRYLMYLKKPNTKLY